MTFSIELWREQTYQQLQSLGGRLTDFKNQDAPYLLYGFLSTDALWPAVQAAVTQPD